MKILHIGNIANNAFYNANILNKYGHENHVIVPDYYHVMGLPEWNLDEYKNVLIDEYYPQYWKINKINFSRPLWFAQGPVDECLEYLFTINNNSNQLQKKKSLIKMNLASAKFTFKNQKNNKLTLLRIFTIVNFYVFYFKKSTYITYINFIFFCKNFYLFLLGFFTMSFLNSLKFLSLTKINFKLKLMFYSFAIKTVSNTKHLTSYLFFKLYKKKFSEVYDYPVSYYIYKYIFGSNIHKNDLIIFDNLINEDLENNNYNKNSENKDKINFTLKNYILSNKQYKKKFLKTEFNYLYINSIKWDKIFKQYDLIIGYAIEGFKPFILGYNNYFCYEHGTLRVFPFRKDLNGRMCRAAYLNSKANFVTNIDNIENALKMGINKTKVVTLPHTLDEKKLNSFLNESKFMNKVNKKKNYFFCPSRHHWVDYDANYSKNNNIIINTIFRNKNFFVEKKIKIIFVKWGADYKKSLDLIEKYKIKSIIEWVNPLNKNDLWKMYINSIAVIDQFALEAFGSVTTEALYLNCKVITRFNDKTIKEFFGSIPPIFNANDEITLFKSMKQTLNNDTYNAHKWMKLYHSEKKIYEIQKKYFDEVTKL